MPSRISYEAKAYVIDEETGRVLGFKNPDSSEAYLAYTNRTGGELFTGDSLTVKTPVATFERSYAGQASFRAWNLLLLNRGELAPSPNDYQNEVHLVMKAGTSSDHRRYINWVGYNDETHFILGVNAIRDCVIHEHQTGIHRLTFQHADNGGSTIITAAGASGKIYFGYHNADTPAPLDVRMHAGGAPDSALVHQFTPTTYRFEQAGGALFYIEAGGNVGINKSNPGYALDIEATVGVSTGAARWIVDPLSSPSTFTAIKNNWTYTTTEAAAGHQFTLVDQDNSDTRAVFRAQGNAGAIDVMFAASSGRLGVNNGAPGYTLDVGGVTNTTTEYRVAGAKVVGARVVDAALASVPTGGSATAAANATAINAILALLVAHGLGATS